MDPLGMAVLLSLLFGDTKEPQRESRSWGIALVFIGLPILGALSVLAGLVWLIVWLCTHVRFV